MKKSSLSCSSLLVKLSRGETQSKEKQMKTAFFKTLVAGITACVAIIAPADTLISGDIGVPGNWSGGVLPTNPGAPGIIDAANAGATRGTIPDANPRTGLAILQEGGELAFTGFGTSVFDDVDYEITGGTFTSTIFGHQIQNGTVFTVNGGAVNVNSFNLESATLDVSSGSMTLGGNLTTKSSVLDFNGGTVSVGGNAITAFNSGTLNFSGNTTFDVTGQIGIVHFAASSAVNIGLGDGSISAGILEADSMTIDWTSGSTFSFEATSILDNGVASSWSQLWDSSVLTIDGGQSGVFSDHFQVTGDALSLIVPVPEPSSCLLMGLAGLALIRRRQR